MSLARPAANFLSMGLTENQSSLLQRWFVFMPSLPCSFEGLCAKAGPTHTDENRALIHVSRTQSKESSHTLQKNHKILQIKLVLGRAEISQCSDTLSHRRAGAAAGTGWQCSSKGGMMKFPIWETPRDQDILITKANLIKKNVRIRK